MKEIQLTQGKVAIVDDADYEWLSQWKWHARKDKTTWYARRNAGNWPHQKAVAMHREIIGAPDGVEVDHKDRDGLHNWRDNLRIATDSQNAANRGKFSSNTSGYKGVSWDSHAGKWKADMQANSQRISLGYFSDPSDAARAYDDAAIEHFGEFAQLNFPRG